jgi:hypothetical protein
VWRFLKMFSWYHDGLIVIPWLRYFDTINGHIMQSLFP